MPSALWSSLPAAWSVFDGKGNRSPTTVLYQDRRVACTSSTFAALRLAGEPGAIGNVLESDRWKCRSIRRKPARPLSRTTSGGTLQGEYCRDVGWVRG